MVDRRPTYHWTTAPAYNTLARIITGLPKWTLLRFLLQEAGLPPVDYLLDLTSQRYGIRIILSPDDHPCKTKVLEFMRKPTDPPKSGTGLHRIADLILELTRKDARLKDTIHHQLSLMSLSEIARSKKEQESLRHKKWA